VVYILLTNSLNLEQGAVEVSDQISKIIFADRELSDLPQSK